MSDPLVTWALPPLEPYPEKKDKKLSWVDKLEDFLISWPISIWPRIARKREYRFIELVSRLETKFVDFDDERVRLTVNDLRARLRGHLDNDQLVAEAFALIRVISERQLSMRHYDVQIQGGFAMLRGFIVEMDTGEGKTLTAILAAATAAMAGIPVHVVSVNDYLAHRDATLMMPVYELLGLTIGIITNESEQADRRQAYACDITYASNKEIAFDYLRDRIALEGKPQNYKMKIAPLLGRKAYSDNVVMRGLHFAIIDEADSVLADEAGTPLIISRQTDAQDESKWAVEILDLAKDLIIDEDYRVLVDQRRVQLTEEGRNKLKTIGEELGGIWKSVIRREESIRQALMALHIFKLGDHYIVQEGKIQIVDEYTGRILADRSWSEGLHQLVEVKEGCEVTSRKIPIARMTYQRFFRRYKRLSGMSGTVNEIRNELWSVYRLIVLTIPTHRPLQRIHLPDRIFKTYEEKWQAVIDSAVKISQQGRPVLIGTRSIADSETLSTVLNENGYAHEMLNAAQDEREAEIISQAGHAGIITVATNMAGRGVDIKLGDNVSNKGGLHVILTERHDARRIDRQLEGRCGRQGDQGSVEALLSYEDQLIGLINWKYIFKLLKNSRLSNTKIPFLLIRFAQLKAERSNTRARHDLLENDQKLGVMMAFSGGIE